MIRVVLFLTAVGLLAFGVAWFADRPGDVVITWMGYRLETSLMVLIGAAAFIAVSSVMIWGIFRAISRSPDLISRILRDRRGTRGYQAISRGMIAVGAGDARAAKRHADEAARLASSEPLTLLLSAQTAQLSGDRRAAERAFRKMAARDDTKLIGLHGLFVEAQRNDDPAAARTYAEEAAAASPSLTWAGEAVLAFRYGDGDWAGALERLEANHKAHLVAKNAYKRQRAVLLTARAMAVEETDRDAAIAFAQEAVKLQGDLVPAAALAGRLLAESGDTRRAARVIDKAWRAQPHPDLADAYMHLHGGASARDRLNRIEQLAGKAPDDPESGLALARAALDAQEFAKARQALAPLKDQPTRRVCLLMAELEEREHADLGRARQWMARALHAAPDPAWTADGVVSDHWMPVSPVSGRLDAFEWRVPLEELGERKPAIEIEERTPTVLMAATVNEDARASRADERTTTIDATATASAPSPAPNVPAAAAGPGLFGLQPNAPVTPGGTSQAADAPGAAASSVTPPAPPELSAQGSALPVVPPPTPPLITAADGTAPANGTSSGAGAASADSSVEAPVVPTAGVATAGAPAAAQSSAPAGPGGRKPRAQPAPERIIPLAHAPDDPGPDADEDHGTVVPMPKDAWRRTR
jgi:HemY protein